MKWASKDEKDLSSSLSNTFSLSAAEASGARGFRLFLLPCHQLIRRGPRAHPADGARQDNQPWTTCSHLTWYSLSGDTKSIIYLPAPSHLLLFSLSLSLSVSISSICLKSISTCLVRRTPWPPRAGGSRGQRSEYEPKVDTAVWRQ